MKKVLLATVTLFLSYIMVTAQESTTGTVKRNFLVLTAGPSFPTGAFASNDINNSAAGFAKTGLAIDLKYGHRFNEILGLTANAVYGRHGFDKTPFGADAAADAYQYYAVLVGPMVSGSITTKTHLDFSLVSGVAFPQHPKLTVTQLVSDGETTTQTQVVTKSDWGRTVPIKAATDIRFGFNNSGFLMVGLNYTYMKPGFSTTTTNGSGSIIAATHKQKMTMFGVNAGIGFNF